MVLPRSMILEKEYDMCYVTKKETPIKISKILFLVCWLVYACSYIARSNFSFARSIMVEQGVIDIGEAGIISAVYFAVYAIGQIVNGILADKKSPFAMVSIGLLLIVVSNFCMTLSLPSSTYCVLWCINGFGQSMLWSPVFFVIANILHTKVRHVAITGITLCTPIGKVSCSLLSSIALKNDAWKNVFYMASAIITIVSIVWITMYLCVKRDIWVSAPELNYKQNDTNEAIQNDANKIKVFWVSGFLLCLPALLIHGLFYNGIVEVIPSILSNSYGLSASMSALLDSIIPIVGLAGVFVSNFVHRVFKKNEVLSAFILMSANILPVSVMFAMAYLGREDYVIGKYEDAVIFVIAYGMIYILQLAFGHMVVSLMAMRYSKFTLAATVSGIANAVNYGGSAIATYGMSYAISSLPLFMTILIWFGGLVVACVTLCFAKSRWKKFAIEEQFLD